MPYSDDWLSKSARSATGDFDSDPLISSTFEQIGLLQEALEAQSSLNTRLQAEIDEKNEELRDRQSSDARDILLMRAHCIDAEQRIAKSKEEFEIRLQEMKRSSEIQNANLQREIQLRSFEVRRTLALESFWKLLAILRGWRRFAIDCKRRRRHLHRISLRDQVRNTRVLAISFLTWANREEISPRSEIIAHETPTKKINYAAGEKIEKGLLLVMKKCKMICELFSKLRAFSRWWNYSGEKRFWRETDMLKIKSVESSRRRNTAKYIFEIWRERTSYGLAIFQFFGKLARGLLRRKFKFQFRKKIVFFRRREGVEMQKEKRFLIRAFSEWGKIRLTQKLIRWRKCVGIQILRSVRVTCDSNFLRFLFRSWAGQRQMRFKSIVCRFQKICDKNFNRKLLAEWRRLSRNFHRNFHRNFLAQISSMRYYQNIFGLEKSVSNFFVTILKPSVRVRGEEMGKVMAFFRWRSVAEMEKRRGVEKRAVLRMTERQWEERVGRLVLLKCSERDRLLLNGYFVRWIFKIKITAALARFWAKQNVELTKKVFSSWVRLRLRNLKVLEFSKRVRPWRKMWRVWVEWRNVGTRRRTLENIYEIFVRRRGVVKWVRWCLDSASARTKMERARSVISARRLKMTLRTWEIESKCNRFSRSVGDTLHLQYLRRLTRINFMRWRTWYKRQVSNFVRVSRMRVRRHFRQRGSCFASWKLHTERAMTYRRKISMSLAELSVAILRRAWITWKLNWLAEMKLRLDSLALAARRRKVKRQRFFNAWLRSTFLPNSKLNVDEVVDADLSSIPADSERADGQQEEGERVKSAPTDSSRNGVPVELPKRRVLV